MAFGINLSGNKMNKELKKRVKELEKIGYPSEKALKKATMEQQAKIDKLEREEARDARIQEIMDKRFCTRDEAEKLLNKVESSENEKKAKEGIKSLEIASKKFEAVSRKMDMQAAKIREEARKSALQGLDKNCKSQIAMVARMRHFGQIFMGISSRVSCCAMQLEAFQEIAALPGIIREINGVMNVCGGLDEFAVSDIKSLGELMNNIDNMIFGIEDMLDEDSFFNAETEENGKLASIVDEEMNDIKGFLINHGGNESPVAASNGANNANNFGDFADTNDILSMLSEETKK